MLDYLKRLSHESSWVAKSVSFLRVGKSQFVNVAKLSAIADDVKRPRPVITESPPSS